ncbi:uncharacterized protein (TIGR03083 family) [Georgenia soli]|uniref:Uncharacterized protein (TIGR03083 family) n=1 Tax=Georgenia soli TaxID=638953 RepID=A0A2A9EPZ3_9MICO|nr:maleylpyruvate isomerase family mycothiol-dependent enzyme [Georgenia soli]PFG40601.1 uncharacterized protein (TIGR03083 family) [Georgenia soli]
MIDDAARLIGREWAAFLELLGGSSWDSPTRLAGWTVEDLARHVHWGMTLEADALEIAAGSDDGHVDGHGGAVHGGTSVGERRAAGVDLEGPRDQIVPALRRARARLLAALAAVPTEPGTVLPMPYGDVPLELGLQVFVMEAAVHRSDLAHAVGADGLLAPDAHAAAATVLQAFWPALAAAAVATPPPGTAFLLRGTTVRVEVEYDGAGWGPPSGPPAVVVSGDDDAVLLAGYGRVPMDAAPVRVEGDRALARRLKEFVPGP